MKKNTKLFTKAKDIRLGLFSLLSLIAMLVFSTSGSAQVLFSQDFASSTTLSTYVNSGSPTTGQFNAITVSGSSTASTATNALVFTRGSGTTSFTRSTNFTTIPSALIYEFDLNVSGTPSGNVAQVATWQVGSGYSTGTNGVESNANTYAQMAIDFRGTGNYRFNDISNTTTSSNFSTGTSRTITWVMNNSGSTLSYVAPDGTTETIAADRMDFWVGTTKVYNDQLVETSGGSLSDLKFAFTSSTGSITIDNIQIQALVTPQVSAFSGNTICSSATGQLTVTTSSGTGPFTVVYNDGANQTVTGVSSGVAFNAVNDPSVTTNYTLVSIAEASGAIRTSGFTDSAATITVNAPIANAGTVLSAICKGSTSSALGGSVSGTATGGTWSDGGVGGTFSPNATTLNATWTPPANYSGTATLTLTTSGGSCGTTTASKTQVVNGQPTATAGGTQTICVNSTATVSGATSSNGTIAWTENGLGSITSGATTLTPVYTPAAGDAGNTITLTMTVSNSPCTAATATYTVVVKALPTATAGGSQTICVNSTATVSGASSSNGTISWTDNGLGSITSGATTLTPVYTPAAGDAGTAVTLTMTVSNSPCAVATATYTVNVNGIPTASAGGSQTICPFATATVSGASSSNGTISWTENGLGSITSGATTLTPVYTPAAGDAGTTVTLTMTVSNSPCAAATATYTVIVSPAAPAAPGTITGSTSVCAGATLLNYSIAPVTNATTYTWTVPSGWAITAGQGSTNITVTAGSASTGSISVVASNSCGNTNPSGTSVLNIAAVQAANNTGYTTSSTKNDGNITCASSLTAPERRGYLKFPLTGLPAGAVITASTLSITNNASGALSGVVNNVNALGNNDPTSTSASTLFTAIGNGTAYNASTWSNSGTIALTLNATAIADMQSRLSSPSYIAMGLFRGQGSSIYNFFGYGGGASAPNLAVTYTAPRSLTVTSNAIVTPTFNPVAGICSGGSLSPLPTTSTNGITGTWAPALNNLATTTYTFTPTIGLCANSTTLQIVVTPNVTPTFTAVAPICSGESLSALPTTSNNGVTGTWSPALNNLATTTYLFTPTPGLCSPTVTMQIVVNPNVTPTFTAVAPICAGATLSALPTTSNNGITGTWSPALNNLATTTYTFTPTLGLCATTTTLQIIVHPILTPSFTAVGSICAGATLSALPTISTNGVSGTWSPALDNTATTTYTFTPNNGECAVSAMMQIVVNPILTPDFTPVASICSGTTLSALPTVSNNGISGTWAPALNNLATTTYTFTPNNGECATPATLTIAVNSNTLYYADADGDSYGNAAVSVNTCLGQPSGYVTNASDCDDTNISIYRNGSFYTDADNDGYNNGAPPTTVCYGLTTPSGYSVTNDGTDCFDMDFNINPNHVEVLGNGKDDNCDGQIDEVGPVSVVTASQCGISLASLATTIYVAIVPAATGYRFEVTNGATVRLLDASVNRFSLLDLNGGAAYATTYTIKVAVQIGGFWQAYGSPCSVSTPNTIATTNIIPAQCGTTLTNIANTIYCDAVAAANQYRFEVSDGINPPRTMDASVNRFEPHHLSGGLNFGTTYSVRVALRFGATWEDFGPACNITTPATPGTSNVIAAQCGINLTNLWGTIYAAQIAVASGYRFEVTKSGGGTVFYDTPNARFSLRNITVPGFTVANATYTIRVAILFNSVYQPFGSACTITTTGAARVTNTPIEVFEVKAYPNPFANTFKLEINTSSENNVSLKVYDMIGREIEVRQSSVSDMTVLEIGNQYPTGVYNLIVTQDDRVKTLRIVKR